MSNILIPNAIKVKQYKYLIKATLSGLNTADIPQCMTFLYFIKEFAYHNNLMFYGNEIGIPICSKLNEISKCLELLNNEDKISFPNIDNSCINTERVEYLRYLLCNMYDIYLDAAKI